MRSNEVLQALHEDHDEVRDLVIHIDDQLRRSGTRGPIEALAAQVLDFNTQVLAPHIDAEDHALLHVAREHLADIHQERLEDAQARLDAVHGIMAEVREQVQTGGDLRKALAVTSEALQDYVDFEEEVLIPWLQEELGETLLREAAQRFEVIRSPERHEVEAFVIDLDALQH